MEITDGDTLIYLLTASILPGPGRRRGDFMATVRVRGLKLDAEYRFRWHVTADKLDMDGGADDDEKSFFTLGPVDDAPEKREHLVSTLRGLAAAMPGFANVHEEIGEWTPKEFVYDVMHRGPMRTQLTMEKP